MDGAPSSSSVSSNSSVALSAFVVYQINILLGEHIARAHGGVAGEISGDPTDEASEFSMSQ